MEFNREIGDVENLIIKRDGKFHIRCQIKDKCKATKLLRNAGVDPFEEIFKLIVKRELE